MVAYVGHVFLRQDVENKTTSANATKTIFFIIIRIIFNFSFNLHLNNANNGDCIIEGQKYIKKYFNVFFLIF
jgi:hypothetical protein